HELRAFYPWDAPARFVLDGFQVQALGAEGRRAARAVARLEQRLYPPGRLRALADVDERADDVAHHVLQPCVGAEREIEALAAPLDRDRVKRAYWIPRLALRRAERGEIVLAEKPGRGSAHGLDIERGMMPARVARGERRAHAAIQEDVAVGARARAVARMKFRIHRLRPQYGHRLRQQRVDAAHPRVLRRPRGAM